VHEFILRFFLESTVVSETWETKDEDHSPLPSGRVERPLRGQLLSRGRRWVQVCLRRTGAPPDRCFLPDL